MSALPASGPLPAHCQGFAGLAPSALTTLQACEDLHVPSNSPLTLSVRDLAPHLLASSPGPWVVPHSAPPPFPVVRADQTPLLPSPKRPLTPSPHLRPSPPSFSKLSRSQRAPPEDPLTHRPAQSPVSREPIHPPSHCSSAPWEPIPGLVLVLCTQLLLAPSLTATDPFHVREKPHPSLPGAPHAPPTKTLPSLPSMP